MLTVQPASSAAISFSKSCNLNARLILPQYAAGIFAFVVNNGFNDQKERYRLLLVDDDEHILLSLKGIFEDAGFSVLCTDNGREAIALAKKFQPHLAILDVIMPGMDGIETCQELKQVPVLQKMLVAFYTARSEDYSQIAGFSAGADDYIVKPLKPRVLLMRVKALLKRHRAKELTRSVQAGSIRIDRERYIVFKGTDEIVLPRKEFELLALLLATPRKVFTRNEIYREIWGGEFGGKNRTIDVHVRKLREKIGDEFIKTVKGIGYSFESN
jgi:two-component system, OmpR family, alkaline phosphatase synthesis response regulator PhoP